MHLAEINIAVTKCPLNDLRMTDFMAEQRPPRAEKD
jgi:hypothetical protein